RRGVGAACLASCRIAGELEGVLPGAATEDERLKAGPRHARHSGTGIEEVRVKRLTKSSPHMQNPQGWPPNSVLAQHEPATRLSSFSLACGAGRVLREYPGNSGVDVQTREHDNTG